MKKALSFITALVLLTGCGGGSWNGGGLDDMLDPKNIVMDEIVKGGFRAFSDRKKKSKSTTVYDYRPLIECTVPSGKSILMIESLCKKNEGEVNWEFMAICDTKKGNAVMKSTECHEKEYRIVGRPKSAEQDG